MTLLDPIRHLGDRFSRGWQAQSPVDAVRTFGTSSKPWVRDGLADVLARVGATAPARFARGALTIVTFHRVLPPDRLKGYPIPGLAVTPEQLALVLGELVQHFECGTVIEAFRRWQREPRAKRPALGISFDDGALDNFEHARPVLAKLGLSATFYVPVDNVEHQTAPWHDRLGFALLKSVAPARKGGAGFEALLAPFGLSRQAFAAILPDDAVRLAAEGVAAAKDLPAERRAAAIDALEAALGGDQVADYAGMMSWDQVRALHAEGHEIGSHSLTHPLLPGLPDERLRDEVEVSRSRLSSAIGASVASFCYPNGSFDSRTVAAVRAAGYECAVTTRWGLNRKQPPLELARCDMDFARLQSRHGEFSRERLWFRLSGLQPGLAEAAPSNY